MTVKADEILDNTRIIRRATLGNTGDSTTSITVNGNNLSGGDTIVVMAGCENACNTTSVLSVTDTSNDIFTRQGSSYGNPNLEVMIEAWASFNSQGRQNNNITVTWKSTVAYGQVSVTVFNSLVTSLITQNNRGAAANHFQNCLGGYFADPGFACPVRTDRLALIGAISCNRTTIDTCNMSGGFTATNGTIISSLYSGNNKGGMWTLENVNNSWVSGTVATGANPASLSGTIFELDPPLSGPFLDGSNFNSQSLGPCGFTNGGYCSVSFAIAGPNDIVGVVFNSEPSCTTTVITDTIGLSWSERVAQPLLINFRQAYWIARYNNHQAANINITVRAWTEAACSAALIGFAIGGNGFIPDFDSSGTTFNSGALQSISVQTRPIGASPFQTVMILGLADGGFNPITYTPGTGYTTIRSTGSYSYAEYKVTKSPGSPATVSYSMNAQQLYGVITDVIDGPTLIRVATNNAAFFLAGFVGIILVVGGAIIATNPNLHNAKDLAVTAVIILVIIAIVTTFAATYPP